MQNHQDAIARQQKINSCYQLKTQGYTYNQLSQKFGVSTKTIYMWLKSYREEQKEYVEDIEDSRKQALDAIDIAIQALKDGVEAQDPQQISLFLKAIDTKAKIQGLYEKVAPKEEVKTPLDAIASVDVRNLSVDEMLKLFGEVS